MHLKKDFWHTLTVYLHFLHEKRYKKNAANKTKNNTVLQFYIESKIPYYTVVFIINF